MKGIYSYLTEIMNQSIAEFYMIIKISEENNNSSLGFKFEEIIAWRFCEYHQTPFNELPLFSIQLDKNLSERENIRKILKHLPKSLFQIKRVENHSLFKKEHSHYKDSQIEDEIDNFKGGSLAYYLQNWDIYKNLAIIPEFVSGPDICIMFENTIIFISIALRKEKVEKDK